MSERKNQPKDIRQKHDNPHENHPTVKREHPMTFQVDDYWWLWIPVLSWLPFFLPILIPLGPIVIYFSLPNTMKFIKEAAAHVGEELPAGISRVNLTFWTLGYHSVYRSYGAAKKMLIEQGTKNPVHIPGWSPWLLPLYFICPAVVLMPFINIMCEHEAWHKSVQSCT